MVTSGKDLDDNIEQLSSLNNFDYALNESNQIERLNEDNLNNVAYKNIYLKKDYEIHFVHLAQLNRWDIKLFYKNEELFFKDSRFPQELLTKSHTQYWINNSWINFALLPDFIKKNSDISLLCIQGCHKYHVKWCDSLEQKTKITFEINKSLVTIQQLPTNKEEQKHIFAKHFRVDPGRQLISLSAYSEIDDFYRTFFSDKRETINSDIVTYNKNCITFNSLNRADLINYFSFRSNNISYNPDIISLKHQAVLTLDIKNNTAYIEPRSLVNKKAISLYNIIEKINTYMTDVPQPLRAKKRQRAIQDGLYDLIFASSEKAKNKIIKKTLSNLDTRKRKLRSYVSDMLMAMHEQIHQENQQLVIHKKKVEIVCFDCKLYLLNYLISLKLFGQIIFDSRHIIEVPLKEFIPKLHQLSDFYEEHQIEFLFNKQKIKEQSLNISVDVSKPKSFDWFALTANVMCHNERIADDAWESIIANGGIYKKGSVLMMLDRNSIDKLKALVSVMPKTIKEGRVIINIPRLQIFDWLSLQKKGIPVKLPEKDREILDNLSTFGSIPAKTLPEYFTGKLRKYQENGLAWIGFLYEHKFGACLADDMGLGKTVQAIAFIGQLREKILDVPYKNKTKTHLIVVPPSLIFNWHHEFDKFYSKANVLEYIGANRSLPQKSPDVILSTYDIVRRDIDILKKINFDVIIFDEAQFIKNIVAKRTSAIRKLRANFKLCLTGTPVENHLGEFFSIMDLALPGIFGKYEEFIKNTKNDKIYHYLKRSNPFILRRTKEVILKELPSKMEYDIYLHLTDHQKSMYTRMVSEVREQVAQAYRYKTSSQAGIVALTALLRLRQICVSPSLVDSADISSSPKMDYLISKLQELNEEGHAALIFSQFTRSLDIVQELLIKKNINFVRMDGKTPVVKRKDIVASFQKKDGPPFFLISLKTGGVGLNLTRASYVFHIDPWWNPAVENQATDRTHRIGQKKKVQVFRLLMHDTVEEKMMVLKNEKAALYDTIMSGTKKTKGSVLSKDEFDYLLTI